MVTSCRICNSKITLIQVRGSLKHKNNPNYKYLCYICKYSTPQRTIVEMCYKDLSKAKKVLEDE